MKRVRFAVQGVPKFRHAGLVFGPGWVAHELDALSDEQAECLRQYVSRFIRVYPSDEAAFKAWMAGDVAEAEPVTEVEPVAAAQPSSDDYAGYTISQLRDLAAELNIELPTSIRKRDDIVRVLEAQTR